MIRLNINFMRLSIAKIVPSKSGLAAETKPRSVLDLPWPKTV